MTASNHIKPSGYRHTRTSKRLTGRADEIVQSARALFEENGVHNTTISDIARNCTISRTLLYYYFPSKDSIIEAVIKDYVEDILDSISIWNEARHFNNISGELINCITTFRRVLYNTDGSSRAMFHVIDELNMRDAFSVLAIHEAVDFISHDIAAEYAAYHTIEIDYVPEMFAMILYGITGLLKAYPHIPDEELAVIITQTLHLDTHPTGFNTPPEYDPIKP